MHTFQQEQFLLLGCVLVMGASLCTIKQRTLLGWMRSMCYAIRNFITYYLQYVKTLSSHNTSGFQLHFYSCVRTGYYPSSQNVRSDKVVAAFSCAPPRIAGYSSYTIGCVDMSQTSKCVVQ